MIGWRRSCAADFQTGIATIGEARPHEGESVLDCVRAWRLCIPMSQFCLVGAPHGGKQGTISDNLYEVHELSKLSREFGAVA
jgi:hypothetical protein